MIHLGNTHAHQADAIGMLKLRFIQLLAVAVIVAAISHVVWSSALAGLVRTTYDHRLPNLAKIKDPANNWISMVSVYSRNSVRPGVPSAAFVGSSFTFGFPQPSSIIFSRVLQGLSKDTTVVNLSIAAADQTGLATMVGCALADAQTHFDVILLELPILNDNAQARSVAAQGGELGRDLKPGNCSEAGDRTWFEYFFRRPYGVQWIPILRDESFVPARPRRLQFPQDYVVDAATYGKIANDVATTREGYIALMSRFARKTIVYPSLIQIDTLVEHGFDRANIERQLADAIAACRKVDGVVCLDTTPFSSRGDLYHDAAHLNRRGHEIFGEWLFQRIGPLIGKPGG